MFFKLALLTASSLARADPSDSSDAALEITASMVNLSSDNRARRTDATGSIRAASKKTGNECSFTNSLKASSVQADVGVLTCAENEFCIEDATSSLGGRCVSSDEEYEYASEFFVTDTHRRLAACSGSYPNDCIECTMSNGDAGKKCDGNDACEWTNTNNIGCGSCNGNKACYRGTSGAVISEGSCNDYNACRQFNYNIGSFSCNGDSACMKIKCDASDNQCNGDYKCYDGGYCPSTSPTASPSTIASPSANPSSSSAPSVSPTVTTSPTESPSSSPSESPSSTPSTSPSESPSSSPSESPSSTPSTSPSESPSSSTSPTSTPTTSPTRPPSKFYPDWISEDMACKNDGEAPQYMVNNAAAWMFDDINTCCAKFFNYKLNACLGASYTGTGKYYPDWLGANEGCLEDIQSSLAPSYMMQSGAFLYTTLDECCERHYNYRVNECKGLSSAGSNMWFVDWKTYKCVKDCDVADGADCGGLADGFWDLVNSYATKEECCRTRVSWDINGCMA